MTIYRVIWVLIAVLFSLSNVQAGESKTYYMSAKVGGSLMEFNDSRYYSALAGDQSQEYDRSSDDNVFGGGVGFGVYWNKNIRTEIEYFYRSTFEYDKKPTNSGIANAHQELKTQSLIVHTFYDFVNKTKLTPFVFAGVGMAYHKTDANAQLLGAPFYTYQGSKSDIKFAWDIGVGAGYALTKNISVDLSYRYISLGEAEWVNNRTDGGDKDGSFADISASELLFTLRYLF